MLNYLCVRLPSIPNTSFSLTLGHPPSPGSRHPPSPVKNDSPLRQNGEDVDVDISAVHQ